ncbi:zona pellucida sperm-binding protein 4-like [Pholidichthys leucotaenia]
MSGLMCDKRVLPKVKAKIHKTVIDPAMLYAMETMPLNSQQARRLGAPEMKMCRWACGHMLKDHVRNDIRKRMGIEECAVKIRERVKCGDNGISHSECEANGCCADLLMTPKCYYPMDECTKDGHFVFAIRADSTTIPVDPTKLVVPGNPQCKPVIVNRNVAIFKFKVTDCGTHVFVYSCAFAVAVSATAAAYLAEEWLCGDYNALNLFLAECRYSRLGAAHPQSMASAGYMVMIPPTNMPSSLISNSVYGVELKIATDHTYTDYFRHDHRPLHKLLRKPVYLELRLKSPKPYAELLVNYCLAYPRSARNALVLLHEGCANPHDPLVSILKVHDLPGNRNIRRFSVSTFVFMTHTTKKYLKEEILFMCSTEVCFPFEKTCEERCFGTVGV